MFLSIFLLQQRIFLFVHLSVSIIRICVKSQFLTIRMHIVFTIYKKSEIGTVKPTAIICNSADDKTSHQRYLFLLLSKDVVLKVDL